MELATTKALIAGLLAWIHLVTGYQVPERHPVIAFMPQPHLQEIACAGPCPIAGFYRDDGVIYLDARLALQTNVCAQSILLHQLVHYVQDLDKRFADQAPLTRWQLRELKAHNVQRIFLAQNRHRRPGGWRLALETTTGPTC
jgi:hypothetical protein